MVVVEGNYVAIGEPFANSFMSSPAALRFCRSSPSYSKSYPLEATKYLSGIVNSLYIPQYHFHPLHYTVYSPLFFREIVDVDRWEEYKMPMGRAVQL